MSSAPVAVPKVDPRSVEKVNSPQHCSKSYGERHLDVPGQPKAFRRRHNSCKCATVATLIHRSNASCTWDLLCATCQQGHRAVKGPTKWRRRRTGWRTVRWSTETTSASEMAWTTGWTRTLILKETWLFLTKQQFSQKSTYRSAATVPGRVGPLKTRHPHGTATMKTSWRPNLSCTDRLPYRSLGPKNTAPVGLHIYIVNKQKLVRAKCLKLTLSELVCVLLYRLGACCSQHILWAPQASVISRWAPWPLAGAKTGDDWSVCQSDGTYTAGWSQQVGMGCFSFFFFLTHIFIGFSYIRVISSLLLIQTPHCPHQQQFDASISFVPRSQTSKINKMYIHIC